jgi:hypothetical protein
MFVSIKKCFLLHIIIDKYQKKMFINDITYLIDKYHLKKKKNSKF